MYIQSLVYQDILQIRMHALTESCFLVAKLCLTLLDPMDCSMPGFSVLHYLPEFAQTHVH